MLTRGALLLDLVLEIGPALLIQGVPFVVSHHQGTSGVDDLLNDSYVLLSNSLLGVDQHDGHLGLLQRSLGTQRRVEVGATGLVDPATDAGRVHEPPRLAAELDQLVDRVTGGSGNLVDNHPVLACELVEETGLADIRAAYQCYSTRPAARVGVADRGELGQDRQNGV
jgi:hypothetical protein